jgi:hypothetical protein
MKFVSNNTWGNKLKDLTDLIGDGTQYGDLRPHSFDEGALSCNYCGKPKEEVEDETEACSRGNAGNIRFYAESAKEMASMDKDIQSSIKPHPHTDKY